MIIQLKSAKYGTNKYHLDLKVIVGRMDVDHTYQILYDGIEIDTNIPLTDSQERELRDSLREEFGMAPFREIFRKEQIFKDGRQIQISDK